MGRVRAPVSPTHRTDPRRDMLDWISLAILIGAGLIAASALTSLASQRLGAPLLLVFLGIGLLAGEDGLLGIDFDSGPTAYFIGSLALAIILFDSGFETPLRSYRIAAAPAIVLSTLGVVLTTGLVGVGARLLLGLGWIESLMLGAIAASTDAAAVFFLLRVGGITLRDRVKSTLEIESGTNDPMAIFLTITLTGLAATGAGFEAAGLELASAFARQMGIGAAAGVAGGFFIAWLLNRLGDLEPGLYPITALSVALMVFAATGMLGGSGFLAAYLAGLVAGNSRVRRAASLRRFQIGMTWLAQIGMFLTLGLLATPSEFGAVALPAVALGLYLIFVARPLMVWLCLMPFRFTGREIAFTGWVGLRGAVSILLAILPSLSGLPQGQLVFNVVFMMVLASLIVQGWTIRAAARRLKLLVPPPAGLVDRIELDLPGKADVELVGYRIHPDNMLTRGARIPRWARPLIILRGERTHSVHDAGPLRGDDRVYLFASHGQVDLLDRVYGSPAGPEELAELGDFVLTQEATLGELAALYAPAVEVETPAITLGEMLANEFNNQPAIGDRMRFGPIELVVRKLGGDDRVAEIGVVLEPDAPAGRGWLDRLLARLG